jgi:hypothetical protein
MIAGKPKNMAVLTLEDGRQIMVATETEAPAPEELVGVAVTLEDGTPLEDGEFKTAEGVGIVVEGGVVTAVTPAVAEEPEPDEAEALRAKVAELEAQLAKKDEDVQDAAQKIEAANKTIKSFKASVEKLEAKYNEMKNMTVGDANPPSVQPQAQGEQSGYDPMAEDLMRYFKGRGIEFNK